MTTHDRFAPRGTLSPEQLKAYAEGRLNGAAAHEVEEHLEADPLLREALDGLRMPGALTGLEALASRRPRNKGTGRVAWMMSAIVLVTAGVTWYTMRPSTEPGSAPGVVPQAVNEQPITAAADAIQPAEIHAAVELPESLQVGHAPTDRHARAQFTRAQGTAPLPVERVVVDTTVPRTIAPPPALDSTRKAVERQPRTSLQLVYLHDLKMLHPKEIYGRDPVVELLARGVDARFGAAEEQQRARGEERRLAYLTFMDEALENFVRNDHKGCLDELRFVLGQYPDDVNALFYAGLCCYNLGLNARAVRFLDRAANHAFDTFHEEAEWYHALALERMGNTSEAQADYQRIAAEGGFYAERAKAKVAEK